MLVLGTAFTCGPHLHPEHKTASLTPIYTGTNVSVSVLCVQIADNKSSDVQFSVVINIKNMSVVLPVMIEVQLFCIHHCVHTGTPAYKREEYSELTCNYVDAHYCVYHNL